MSSGNKLLPEPVLIQILAPTSASNGCWLVHQAINWTNIYEANLTTADILSIWTVGTCTIEIAFKIPYNLENAFWNLNNMLAMLFLWRVDAVSAYMYMMWFRLIVYDAVSAYMYMMWSRLIIYDAVSSYMYMMWLRLIIYDAVLDYMYMM